MTELVIAALVMGTVVIGYGLIDWVLGPEPDEWWPGERPRWRP